MDAIWPLLSLLLLVTSQARGAPSDPDVGITEKQWDSFKSRFKDTDAFERFRNFYKKGLLGKDKVFNIQDPSIIAETEALIDLLSSAKNVEKLFTTLLRLEETMNTEQIFYALVVTLMSWKGDNPPHFEKEGKRMNAVEWYNGMPNYFVPNQLIEKIVKAANEGTYNKTDYPLIVPDQSESSSYMTEDPVLNSMYYNWQIMFPTWAHPNKLSATNVKNRGALYYDFYRQLISNFYIKEGMHVKPFNWYRFDKDVKIKRGFKTQLRNFNGQPIASRSPMSDLPKNEIYEELAEIENKLEESRLRANKSTVYVNDTYLFPLSDHPEMTREILSNLVFNTTESLNPEYYMSLYQTAIKYLASIGSDPTKDGGGPAGYPLLALRDPGFYDIMNYVLIPIQSIQYYISGSYKREDLTVEDVAVESIEVDRLETFYEPIEIDLKEAIGKMTPLMIYTVEQLRINHKPFAFRIKMTNNGTSTRNAIVTIALILERGKPIYSPVDNSYQIMDRFPVEILPGKNTFERNFTDSMIFTDENQNMLRCGIPKSQALPKGTAEGLNFTLAAFISPYDPSKIETSSDYEPPHGLQVSPLCGNTALNYGLSFGFPLDKEIPSDVSFATVRATIYHEMRTFRGGVIL